MRTALKWSNWCGRGKKWGSRPERHSQLHRSEGLTTMRDSANPLKAKSNEELRLEARGQEVEGWLIMDRP